MNDMERRKFEDSFKDAFERAEISPSESVWTNIELDLERAESGKMKRRILFYKLLAAASVAFAMSVAGVGYYSMKNQTVMSGQLAESSSQQHSKGEINQPTTSGETDNVSGMNNASSERTTGTSVGAESASNELSVKVDGDARQHMASTDNSSLAQQRSHSFTSSNDHVPQPQAQHQGTSEFSGQDRTPRQSTITSQVLAPTSLASTGVWNAKPVDQLPSKVKPTHSLTGEEQAAEVDPVAVLMAKLEQREKELQAEEAKENKKNNFTDERLWTSVGFAAGAFSAGSSEMSASATAFNTAANQQVTASGVAYSMGVSVGTRLSNRWVLQGGVNYQTQSSDYTANSVVGTSDFQEFYAASVNTADKVDNRILSTDPYSVNNSLRFVTVPMQAGYMVVNKQFGLQLNAGLSTDLFLQNTITPEGGSLDKTTQGRGEESPYRSVNFSGLFGTELTYKIGNHYRVALNPGLRYPLNSIYKSDTGIDSAPLTFDVGLRFRYIFQP